jgi:carbonic anhydrase/acetyltransferase-like protein (isoleucine patch superfamily)
VTFHALEETDIELGDDLTAEDYVVFHGPLRIRNGISVGDRSVVFQVIVEDNVQIGEGVMIVGPAVAEGEELSFTNRRRPLFPTAPLSPTRIACRRS